MNWEKKIKGKIGNQKKTTIIVTLSENSEMALWIVRKAKEHESSRAALFRALILDAMENEKIKNKVNP